MEVCRSLFRARLITATANSETNGYVTFDYAETQNTRLTGVIGQYLILSGALGGIGTGCWYVAEAGAIMTLAPSGARGKYLALWIVSRNLGQLVGGAIK